MSVIRYHVSLAFSSLPPDSSQRLDILLGEDIYIYIHTIAPWKNLVAVEMVNRPLGLVFRFSKPSHHFHEHIYSNVEQKDTIVKLLEGA